MLLLYVRPSVPLSVTHKPVLPKWLNLLSRKQRRMLARDPVFWRQRSRWNSNRINANIGTKYTWDRKDCDFFSQITCRIAKTVQDRDIVSMNVVRALPNCDVADDLERPETPKVSRVFKLGYSSISLERIKLVFKFVVGCSEQV